MSNNIKIHVFTDEQLEERDLKIIQSTVKLTNRATTKHVAREMIKKNTAQQLQAVSKNGLDNLYFDDDIIEELSDNILKSIKNKNKI